VAAPKHQKLNLLELSREENNAASDIMSSRLLIEREVELPPLSGANI
jgi:hypothetical protein